MDKDINLLAEQAFRLRRILVDISMLCVDEDEGPIVWGITRQEKQAGIRQVQGKLDFLGREDE